MIHRYLAPIAVAIAVWGCNGTREWSPEIVQRVTSPDGQFDAVEVQEEIGDFHSHTFHRLFVEPKGKDPITAYRGNEPLEKEFLRASISYRDDIRLKWLAPDVLEVRSKWMLVHNYGNIVYPGHSNGIYIRLSLDQNKPD